MRILIAFLLAGIASAQISIVQVSATSAGTPADAAIATPSGINLTSGNSLLVFSSRQEECINFTAANQYVLTNSGTTPITFLPVYPSTGGSIVGLRLVAGGTGYSTPICEITGGGGTGATCSVTLSGSAIVTVRIEQTGTGFTSEPAISITGGGGTGASAVVAAIGIVNGTTPRACTIITYAHNIPANTGDVFTANGVIAPYRSISVYEVAGLEDAAPDAAVGSTASATSITSAALTTTDNDTLIFAGSRVEALTQTWTAGSSNACASGGGSCTLNPGGGIGSGADTFSATMYKILATTVSGSDVSISSGGNAARVLNVAVFKGTPAAPSTRRRIITVIE